MICYSQSQMIDVCTFCYRPREPSLVPCYRTWPTLVQASSSALSTAGSSPWSSWPSSPLLEQPASYRCSYWREFLVTAFCSQMSMSQSILNSNLIYLMSKIYSPIFYQISVKMYTYFFCLFLSQPPLPNKLLNLLVFKINMINKMQQLRLYGPWISAWVAQ